MHLAVAFITATPCILPVLSKKNSGTNNKCSPWHSSSKSRFVSNEFAASVRGPHIAAVNTSGIALTAIPRAVLPIKPLSSGSSTPSEVAYALPPPRRHSQPRRTRKVVKQAAAQKDNSKKTKTKTKTKEPLILRRSGMNAAVVLSGDIATFCGTDMMLRREVIGKICDHIRVHGLKNGKRSFKCDDTLSRLLKTEGTFLFVQINGMLSRLEDVRIPSEVGPQYVERGERMFQHYIDYCDAMTLAQYEKLAGDKRGLHSKQTQQKHMERKTGMYSVVYIKGALSEVCEGKTEITRPQLIKCVWNYIKKNQLQDENKKRMVFIDDKLRQALKIGQNIDAIDSFQITGYVTKQYSSIPPG